MNTFAQPMIFGRFFVALTAFLMLVTTSFGCELSRFSYTQPHMGTNFRVVLYTADQAQADAAAKAAFARISELNSILSDYDPNSELSKLSKQSQGNVPTQWNAVSDDLYKVLAASRKMSQQSDGAFDVTVGPYVQMWRRSRRQRQLPDADQIAKARKSVGYEKLEIDPTKQRVRLLAKDMLIDLGGIAKGYALDEALATLKEHGVNSALVDGGGDVAVSNAPPRANEDQPDKQRGWKLALVSLDKPNQTTGEYALLENAAIATSGDTYRFVEIDGKRYSHIIDPQTGLGLTNRIGVTIIAKDGMTADALASAVSVSGDEIVLELIKKVPNAAGRVVRVSGEGVDQQETDNFAGYLTANEDPANPVE